MVAHYSTLTGSTVTWINALPWLLVAAAAAGVVVAVARRPNPAPDLDAALPTASEPT